MIITQDTAVAVMSMYTPYFKFKITPQGTQRGESRYYLLESSKDTISSLQDLVPSMVYQYLATTQGRENIFEIACRAQLIQKLDDINKRYKGRYVYRVRDVQIKPSGLLFNLYFTKSSHVRKVPTNHLDKRR